MVKPAAARLWAAHPGQSSAESSACRAEGRGSALLPERPPRRDLCAAGDRKSGACHGAARRRIQFWQRQCRKHGMHRPAVCRNAGNRCADRGRKLGPEPCDGHHKTGTLRHPVRHHSAGHPALFKRLRAENAVKFPYRTKIK